MRKPRDYGAELKALDDKARMLKARRMTQLGELVAATGADALDAETLAGGLLTLVEAKDAARKESWRSRGQAFFQRRPSGAPRRPAGGRGGDQTNGDGTATIEASKARVDTREWVMHRRERTRQLIELGGLVAKARLVVLTGDDRAALYGAMLAVADRLGGDDRERALALWGRRGHQAFEADANARKDLLNNSK